MIVEETLLDGIEGGRDGQAVGRRPSRGGTEHRSGRRVEGRRHRSEVEPAIVLVLGQRTGRGLPATTTSPPGPAAVISRRTTGTPISGGSISMPAIAIIFGIEPRLAIPMPAHAVQSMAMPRVSGRVVRKLDDALAQQVVGRAVVGLAAVPEAAGDRS